MSNSKNTSTDETYVVNLEAALKATQIRNAELCWELSRIDENNPILKKPLGYSRARRITNIIDAALDHVYGSESEDNAYDALVAACDDYSEYWEVKQVTKDKSLRMKRYWKDAKG